MDETQVSFVSTERKEHEEVENPDSCFLRCFALNLPYSLRWFINWQWRAAKQGSAPGASSNNQIEGLYGPNLTDFLTKPGTETAALLEDLDEYVDGPDDYYYGSNADFSAFMSSSNPATAFPTQDGAYIFKLYNYDEGLNRKFGCSKDMLAEGSSPNPNLAKHLFYLDKKPSTEELANIVDSITPFDEGFFYGYNSTSTYGSAKGNGCICDVSTLYREDTEDTIVSLELWSINGSSYGKLKASTFDSEYAQFDMSKYSDSYVK